MQAEWSTVLLGIQGSDRDSCGVGSFYQTCRLGYGDEERKSGWGYAGQLWAERRVLSYLGFQVAGLAYGGVGSLCQRCGPG